MLNKLPYRLTQISDYSVVFFVTLFPIYFLPFTYDLFELNKSTFIVAFSIWFLLLIGVKSLVNKSLIITTSYLLLPIALILLSYLLAGVFSYSTSYSLWGIYGFLGNTLPVLLATSILVISIPTLVSNQYVVKKAIIGLSVSFFIVVLTSFIAYFSFIPASRSLLFLSNININFAGGFVYLRYFLGITAFVFCLGLLNVRRKALEYFYFVALVLTLSLASLVLNIYFLLFVLVCAVLPFLAVKNLKVSKQKLYLSVFSLVLFVLLSVTCKIPAVEKGLSLSTRVPVSSGINFTDSWVVTSRAFAQKPIFGYGPSTFLTVFSFYKPQSVNSTIFWDTLFVKPFSFYMLVLVELGILGILSLSFLLYKLVRNLFNVYKNVDTYYTNYIVGLKLLVMLMFLMFLTTSGNAFLMGLLFILLSLVVSLEKFVQDSKVEEMTVSLMGEVSKKDSTSILISGVNKVFSVYKVYIIVILVVVGLAANFVYKVVAADIQFLSFSNPPKDLLQARDNYAKAASINPRNDFYQKSIIQLDRTIVQTLINNAEKQEKLLDEQKKAILKDITTVLKDAVARADFITADNGLNTNPQNWETKGLVFQTALGLANNADVNALRAYNEAFARNPLNPRIAASIGNVYFYQKKYQEAANAFYRAVQLKPDYAVARYNLAKSLEQLKQYDNALTVAKTLLTIVKPDSEDYKMATDYIKVLEELKATSGEAPATTEKIDLDTAPTEGSSENQPELSEPGEPIEPAGSEVAPQTPVANPTPNVTDPLPNQSPTQPGGRGFVETPGGVVTPTPTPVVTPSVSPTVAP